jgi:CrcB protein
MGSEQLFQFALVALGGAIGAALRYGVYQVTPPGPLSWGTFAANIIGCFLICFVFFKFADMSDMTRLFLFTGIFGGFTTLSAVSLEMVQFFDDSMIGRAILVFAMNGGVCLGAGFLGRWTALLIA